eukprot:SAG31_NODE_3925_length_3746_cov_2.099260_6_plen_44_part_01
MNRGRVDHDGGEGAGVQNQHGYYAEYEASISGCVRLDRTFPIYA